MIIHRRGGHNVLARMGVVGLALALSAPISGQQLMTVATPKEEALKNNVRTFEWALKGAITSAGQKLAQWAGSIAPNVALQFAAEPAVRSVPLPDDSLIFHVEVSEILPTSISLFTDANRYKGQQVGAMSAPGLVAPDPMKGGPVASPLVTPDQQYTTLVRQALIDAMLDSSGVLPIKAGQTLTVACNPVDVLVTNQLQRNPSRQLVLTIKGEDLLAYRNGTLSREDAKQRILERRF